MKTALTQVASQKKEYIRVQKKTKTMWRFFLFLSLVVAARSACSVWRNELGSTACLCFATRSQDITGTYVSAVGSTKGFAYPLRGSTVATAYDRMMSWSVAWEESTTAWSGTMPLQGKEIWSTWILTQPGDLWSNTLIGKDHFTFERFNKTCE